MSEPSKSPSEGRRSEAVLGPFTIRDLVFFGGALITLVASVLPVLRPDLPINLWNASNAFFLLVGALAPVAAGVLFAWRRLAPEAKLRVGSLSVDQFASVVAVMTALFYFVFAVTALSSGGLVGLLGGLVMVASATLARLIPPFAVDFSGRAEVPAHVVARDAVPPVPRPKRPAGAGNQTRDAGARGAAAPADAGIQKSPLHGSSAVPGAEGSGAPRADAPRGGSAASGAAFGVAGAAAGAASGAAATGAAAGHGAAAWAGHSDPAAWIDPDEAAAAPSDVSEPAGSTEVSLGAGGLSSARSGDPAAVEATEAHIAARDDAGRTASAAAADVEHSGPARAAGVPGASPEPDATEAAPVPDPGVGAAPATAVFPASAGEPRARENRGQTGEPYEFVGQEEPAGQETAGQGRDADSEEFSASKPYEEEAASEAFWFAVSQPRIAADASTGRPLFTLQPGQWILALQDRGHEFVVQSSDGRVGILRELSGIERA